jgi:2-keto-4-pentenoate hydratase
MNSLAEARPLTDRLLDARRNPDGNLDLSAYPISRFEALALQLQVADSYAREGDPIGGWKVAYTSGGQRDRFGEGYRAFGFVPRSRVLVSGDKVRLSELRGAKIEIELCLRTTEGGEVQVAPAFELTERRVSAAADPATMVADGCSTGPWSSSRDGCGAATRRSAAAARARAWTTRCSRCAGWRRCWANTAARCSPDSP